MKKTITIELTDDDLDTLVFALHGHARKHETGALADADEVQRARELRAKLRAAWGAR